jgi:hypothetical protein
MKTNCNHSELLRQLRENKLSVELSEHLTECNSCREQADTFKLLAKLNDATLAMPHSRLFASAILRRHRVNLLVKKQRRIARISFFAAALTVVAAVMMIVFVLLGNRSGNLDEISVHLPLIVAICVVLTALIVSPMRSNNAHNK